MSSGLHSQLMNHALTLAKKGLPDAFPNPLVGCVIVHKEQIVAEGWHQKYGEAHAEVNAIHALSKNIDPAQCTLYVNLEPCSHHGKTPPCADLIIKSGFRKVVIANKDPNPLVAGKGIEKLRSAGIEVIEGVMEKEGFELNKRFFTFHQKKRPYIILKWAETADGFISRLPVPSDRTENMISTKEQLIKTHELRATSSSILVGKNTVLADDPSLTTRLVVGKNPVRIFIDKNLEVPRSFKIYNNEANTIVFNAKKEGVEKNISFVQLDFFKKLIPQILTKMYEMNLQSLLVEGGKMVLESFLEEKMMDEIVVLKNEKLFFGSGVNAPKLHLP
ncbi:MAG TPA: bifunctional diaminohydroxyphosphoribosylaminopyrimidine deaminase/5-amino-6-(5-phosphoribosylamino)uracil reductase RibD [Bacteroidia bacterium]|nr:bifunctional diaminohydroxyphosphoribosylaminopyrimidine deaminase/5-amino-6-(5-phosphoribosylamino)uracil reductase RibD [Bacteroidia bacterium]